MFEDNKTSLTLIKDLGSQNHTKYINLIYYHIQKLVENIDLEIE